jgi:hypothetical protein
MAIEIDFLAVGEGERSGDAICLRYGNLLGPRNQQVVLTIDGGTLESGERVVEHITGVYGTDFVDAAFVTHPDSDHVSGARIILEKLGVGALLMHRPWAHSEIIHDVIECGDITAGSLRRKTQSNLSAAYELEQTAKEKKIDIVEPFAGVPLNAGLTILGPSFNFYVQELSQFGFMPPQARTTPRANLLEAIEFELGGCNETWFSELLREPEENAISPENHSSLILLLTWENNHHLFTSDAGVRALAAALDLVGTIWS